jgi:hypothetical protein
MTTKLGMANLEMKFRDHTSSKQDRKLVAINCSITSLQKKMDRALERARSICPTYSYLHPMWIKVDELEIEMDQLNQLLRDLINDADLPAPPSSVDGGKDMLYQIISIDGGTPKRARKASSYTSELMNSEANSDFNSSNSSKYFK